MTPICFDQKQDSILVADSTASSPANVDRVSPVIAAVRVRSRNDTA